MTRLIPRQPVPPLEIPTVDGGLWSIVNQSPAQFTMIVAYRGLHCPICKPYLRDLNRRMPDFAERGVTVLAMSCDVETRARTAKEEWGLEDLVLGYDLPIDTARQWGLFLSGGIKEDEPAQFCEPGVFLVSKEGLLYLSIVNSMPFARPSFAEVLQGLDFVIPNRYPARGELA